MRLLFTPRNDDKRKATGITRASVQHLQLPASFLRERQVQSAALRTRVRYIISRPRGGPRRHGRAIATPSLRPSPPLPPSPEGDDEDRKIRCAPNERYLVAWNSLD